MSEIHEVTAEYLRRRAIDEENRRRVREMADTVIGSKHYADIAEPSKSNDVNYSFDPDKLIEPAFQWALSFSNGVYDD